ncbi:MAG: hypothetical protein WBZ36_19320 [Candidatus Nitrosopolaris sp.]
MQLVRCNLTKLRVCEGQINPPRIQQMITKELKHLFNKERFEREIKLVYD